MFSKNDNSAGNPNQTSGTSTQSAPQRRPFIRRPEVLNTNKSEIGTNPSQFSQKDTQQRRDVGRRDDKGGMNRMFKSRKPKEEVSYDLKKAPKDKLVIFAFGGTEEIGNNMMGFMYNNDIVIIDMGLEFPDEELLGIDYIIPDVSSLAGLEKNIRGVFITHGHYDHIGAIPHLIDKLGNPPIYGLKLTIGVIKKRQEDFMTRSVPRFIEVGGDDTLQLGVFKLTFIKTSHSIPDSVMVVMDTPVGKIVHTGDWKIDLTPAGTSPTEIHKIAALHNQNVLALFGDSTNADQPGHQLSELEIRKTIEQIFKQAKGRIIIGTFASLLSRVQHIISVAEELGKKVVIDGRSMKANVQLAHELGYIKFSSKTIIEYKDMKDYPVDKIVVACTGAQGEENAVLMRITSNEHKSIQIIPGDTVIFSSSIIPGNERSVQKLRDSLYSHHANVINYHMMDVHAGGHAKQEDIKLLIRLINPEYYVPIYGTSTHIHMNADIAKGMGLPAEKVMITTNGQIITFDKDRKGTLTEDKIIMNDIFVDGLGIGDVSDIVIRDRKQMSEHGMLTIISMVNRKTMELVGNPDIISRGFIYMNANKRLVEEIRQKVVNVLLEKNPEFPNDPTYLKEKIREEIGKFIYKKTHRIPMILPVILEM